MKRGRLIPFVVLLAGLLATLAAALYVDTAARRRDEIHFDGDVQQLHNRIATRVETYVALLRASAGLFAASREVSLSEFREFVGRLELRTHYPGIQGIGFAKRLGRPELGPTVAALRAEHGLSFAVSPDTPREWYFPIVYLEPLDDRNRAALGFDMFTEPVRHEAMDRAAATGVACASGRVTLKQEIDARKQAGFLIYVPVYRRGAPTATEDERRKALAGFVYSPFRAGDFLRRAVIGTETTADLAVRVYDGGHAAAEHLLFDGESERGDAAKRLVLRRQRTLDVRGRSWLLDIRTSAAFEAQSERRLLPWILVVGFVVTGVLSWLTASEVKARTSAERAARDLQRSEEALRASESELRRVVDAERQAHAEAEAANRAKDEFLATLSHELRTPLNAILGWATMLKRSQLSQAQQERAVDVIARNARTQAELIEDLLDVSRIITGKLRIDMQPATLGAAILAALDAVRPGADAKGVALVTRLSVDGPVLGDPDRLQQVAWNLLSNAIKFTPAGGRVEVHLEQQGADLVFAVADNGIGIDGTFLPHVFERFRQRDSSTTRTHGGMGLGLAIVRYLVELHGGSVEASSAGEGRGSTFIVRLPVRAVKARESGERHRADQPETPGNLLLRGLRTLVVDDEHDSREMLGNALTEVGAVVTTAASAADALRVLEQQSVDVMLADISMPEADGYELMRRVREHPLGSVHNVPAVAVTAHARDEDRDRARAAGFDVHIAKPVDLHALLHAVRRLVDSAEL